MNGAKSLPPTPWDFKMRAAVFGIIYGVGFGAGISLQYAFFGSAAPTYAYLGQRWGDPGIHAAAFAPVFLSLVGQAIRMWGTSYLSSGIVWSGDVRTGSLLLSGPYRYVRNPLYLGNVFAAVGFGMLGPPISTLIIVVGVTLFVLRLISIEERFLNMTHGQQYRDYCSLVPKLLPRMTPAPVEADPRPAAWGDAFWGEFFFLCFVIIALYNALFTWHNPNWGVLWIVFFATLIAGMIIRRLAGLKPSTP